MSDTPAPVPDSFKLTSLTNCRKCHGEGRIKLYDRVEPFNPNSSPQVTKLIKHFGLKMPIKRGTQDETTEAKYLKRFAKKGVQKCSCAKGRGKAADPDCPKCEGKGVIDFGVFNDMLDYRKRTKMVGTYIWPLDSDNRVHTTYGFNPSTWRKSSKNVNLQNIPIRDPILADLMRETIIASPGCTLVEADAESIEAVLVGYGASDPDYIRICKAGLHGFVCSHRMALEHGGKGIDPGLEFSELRRQCKSFKREHKKQYDDAKRGDHAVNYMLSAYGMWDEYPETFPTKLKAQEFIDFYHSLFPKIRPWQQATLERAHKETFLDNHFGYRHYFYDVFAWNHQKFKRLVGAGVSEAEARRQAWELGEDAKRAVAFVPQSDASAIQTEDLIELDAHPSNTGKFLRMVTHDSFTLDVPNPDVADVVRIVRKVMTRSRPELGGLAIGAELKVGKNLKTMEVVE